MPLTDKDAEALILNAYDRGQNDFKAKLVAVLQAIRATRNVGFSVSINEVIDNVKNLNNIKPELEVSDE